MSGTRNRIAAAVVATGVLVAAILAIALGGGSSGGREHVRLLLDFFPNADHAGIYAAQADGTFKAQGLSVSIHTPSDTSAQLKLLAAGKTDFAISYEPEVLLARDKGAPVVAVAALVRVPLTSIVSLPKAGIRTPADLRGKKVGTAGIPYQSAYLQAILARAGVPRSSVKERNVGFDLVPALLTGKVDAVLGAYWNYEAVQLRQKGKAPRVIRIEQAGVPSYDELVVATSESEIKKHPDRVRRFLAGLAQGTERLIANPVRETQHGLLRLNRNLDPKLQQASVAVTRPYFVPDTEAEYGFMAPGDWAAFTAFMHRAGLLKAATPGGAFTDRFLPSR
jgi:putative hydroxymethylpyrimidine transport system substrate-binding protein